MRKIKKIMAIHGLWGNSKALNPILDTLLEKFPGTRVYAPNIRWETFNWEVLREEFWNFRPDVVIGYSFGGYLVQKLSETNPEFLKLCVLIAPVPPKGITLRFSLKLISNFPWQFVKATLTGKIGGDKNSIRKILGLPEDLFRRYHHCAGLSEKKNSAGTFKTFLFLDTVKKPISVPTLVIGGKKDKVVSPKNLEETSSFHMAEKRVFSDIGHGLVFSPIVAKSIKEWVSCQMEYK